MTKTVFIMAAGQAIRCFDIPKQLLVLPDGRTILGRLISQVESCNRIPIIVSCRPQILEAGKSFYPLSTNTLCDSILSTEALWSDTNLFILGDVVFSWVGFARTMNMAGDMTVVGNELEIYAMQFTLPHRKKVVRSLEKAARYRMGGLRYFYKMYAGLPFEGLHYEKEYLIWLRDETKDIDSIDDYKNMLVQWHHAKNQPGYGSS